MLSLPFDAEVWAVELNIYWNGLDWGVFGVRVGSLDFLCIFFMDLLGVEWDIG
jgi:hypothetical protein